MMSDNTDKLFDTLSVNELDIAKQGITEQENRARQYGIDFPRELPVAVSYTHLTLPTKA